MKSLAAPLFALISLALFAPADAQAQLPSLKVYAAHPPGGQPGTTFDYRIVSGAEMDELNAVTFSHPGITAAAKKDGNGNPIANTFDVTIAADVPPGIYEMQAKGLFGVSNPRAFVVDARKQLAEVEPNNTQSQASPLELNATIFGLSNGKGDVDWFKFAGQQGQRVIASCQAMRIDSRMEAVIEVTDASGRRLDFGSMEVRRDPMADVTLPADGEYYLRVYDIIYDGSNDHFYRLSLHTGPHIDLVLPSAGKPGSTGTYTLYGRNLPGSKPSTLKFDGHPLEELQVSIALPNEPGQIKFMNPVGSREAGMDGNFYALPTPQGNSNPVLIQYSAQNVLVETEPNDKPEQTQKITVPTDVAGLFQARGDADRFDFDAKKGDVYIIEVIGQRLGSPADPFYVVEQITRDAAGKETAKRLTIQDDTAVNVSPNLFDTLNDDPVWKFVVPEDGTFRVTVQDRYSQSRGDASLAWRLCIRKPQPDFRLVALPFEPSPQGNGPGSVSLRKGGNDKLQVMVFRQDEFAGPVEISAEGLPAGVTCKPVAIGEGGTVTQLIFSAADNAALWSGPIKIVGKAKVKQGEQEVELVREARSATVVWKSPAANQPTEARLAREPVTLAVTDEVSPFQALAQVDRLEVYQGSQILIPVKLLKREGFDEEVKLAFQDLPNNSNIQLPQNPAVKKGEQETLLRLFVNNNAKVGTYSVYLQTDAQINYVRNPQRLERAKKAQAEQDAKLKEAQKAAQEAKTAAAKANTDLTATTNLHKQAVAAKPAADQALTKAQQAQQQAEAAKKQLDEKLAAAKDDKEKNALKPQLEAAGKALAAAVEQVKKTTEAVQQADAKIKELQTQVEARTKAKTDADALAKTTDDAAKAATAGKQAADKEVTDATNIAKPKGTKVNPPSTPVVLIVKDAPASVTAAGGGNLKLGQSVEVKVTVTREKDVTGPVTLTLPLPPGVKGLTAAAVTIPADKNEAVVKIQAAGDATEGKLETLVIRAELEHQGKVALDAPVNITVVK